MRTFLTPRRVVFYETMARDPRTGEWLDGFLTGATAELSAGTRVVVERMGAEVDGVRRLLVSTWGRVDSADLPRGGWAWIDAPLDADPEGAKPWRTSTAAATRPWRRWHDGGNCAENEIDLREDCPICAQARPASDR